MNYDTGTIDIRVDPTRQRLTGRTNHGGLYFDIPYVSEIAPNLWQGGCQDGLVLPKFISHLLSLYMWEQYTVSHKLRTSHTVEMRDSVSQSMSQVDKWARWVNARRRTGPVLVHCQAGLNRSSLVVCRALMLDGWTANDAIYEVREKRSPACLCNDSFEQHLRSIG